MVLDPATHRPSHPGSTSGAHKRDGGTPTAKPARAGRPGRGLDVALVLIGLAFAATFVYPWYQGTVREENERGAIAFMKEIHRIEGEHKAKIVNGQHRYAVTFFELAAAGLLPGAAPEGAYLTRGGYIFKLGTPGDAQTRYFAIAHPERPGVSGERSFYVDDSGSVRASPGMAVGPAFPEEK